MTVADAVVKCLENENVKLIFGYPGAAICPIYDSLTRSSIKHILVRQEQNAGHAASGYARITKRPAVCIATSGPGALNLITAIATAYVDSIPLVVITGQVPLNLLGRDVFQEADITGAAEPFVKHSYLIKQKSDVQRIIKEAFFIASTGRQGPVLIDIPVDILHEKIKLTNDFSTKPFIRSYNPEIEIAIEQITLAIAALSKAKKPLICAGGGIFASNAEDELLNFSKEKNIPVVTTMMGISSISPTYPLHLGMIGMYGAEPANKAMNMADLLILVGARVGDRAIMSPMGLSADTTILHIDIDPAEIGKNIDTDIPIIGDAKAVLSKLSALSKGMYKDKWAVFNPKKQQPYLDSNGTISPHEVIAKLCKSLDSNAIICADVGQNLIWTAAGYTMENGRFLTSGGMGTMGYSIPCAIGAKLAADDRQTIAICGDGGFQMCMNELATIMQSKLDIKIILMNNSCLGMVKELQDNSYASNEIAVKLDGSPNYTALAKAYSIPSICISDRNEIDNGISEMLSHRGAFLLECKISPTEKVQYKFLTLSGVAKVQIQ